MDKDRLTNLLGQTDFTASHASLQSPIPELAQEKGTFQIKKSYVNKMWDLASPGVCNLSKFAALLGRDASDRPLGIRFVRRIEGGLQFERNGFFISEVVQYEFAMIA